MNIKIRQQILLKHPRIKKLKTPQPCEGIKWGTVAVRDVHTWGPGRSNPPRGFQPRSRCKKQGWWVITPRRAAAWPDGITEEKVLCWDHFINEFQSHSKDHVLLTKWWFKQPEVLEYIEQHPEVIGVQDS